MNHRRQHLLILLASIFLMALALTGCNSGNSSVAMGDLPGITAETMGDLLLGPPADATQISPPDPPLLKKGKKEAVLVAADTASFAAISRGAISEGALKDTLKETVRLLNNRLKPRGFTATISPTFPPTMPTDDNTLVATLVPATEEGGSPQDKAEGKQRTMVLVRLAVTDPTTGTVLRARDYYSGRDVKRGK